ncbi:MAG: ATP synthase F1 subunit epsilon [Clostridiales Family XIII bacterium]|nr:ATP synthase F1 subunit epsilon [Clostridiales Family XIII bacterium]
MGSVRLEVVTPEKKAFSGDVEIVIVRTRQGYEGFMAKHSWACKLLGTGELVIKEAGASGYRLAAASGGFIDVKDSITIFAESIEWETDIDKERAEEAGKLAEKWLAENKDTEDKDLISDYREAAARSANRLKVAAGGHIVKK